MDHKSCKCSNRQPVAINASVPVQASVVDVWPMKNNVEIWNVSNQIMYAMVKLIVVIVPTKKIVQVYDHANQMNFDVVIVGAFRKCGYAMVMTIAVIDPMKRHVVRYSFLGVERSSQKISVIFLGF
jgi:hypothetical protein